MEEQIEVVDNRQEQIKNAEMMQSLIDDDRFKHLFQEIFIDAFAITNVYNAWTYDDTQRRSFLEKTMARSTFVRFIDEVLEDGRSAIQSIHADQAEEQDNEDYE